jgi:hypothetical protein
MAVTEKKTAEAPAEKRVKIKLPKEARGEENFITASLNGKVYKIMKGVEVEIPEGIAEILVASDKAYEDSIKYIESVQ